jgi:CheY-like chemotaxis protein
MVSEATSVGAVLIVDDDDDHRELTREFLEAHGYRVFGAVNGAEALRILGTIPGLKLIVVDLTMPVMDGRTLIKHIRADVELQHLPIVVCSAEDVDPPSGVFDFVKKPSRLDRLLEIVRLHCD